MLRRFGQILSVVVVTLTALYMAGGFLQKLKDAGTAQFAKVEGQLNSNQHYQQQQQQQPYQAGSQPYQQQQQTSMAVQDSIGPSTHNNAGKMNIA